jgi:hypothetical protein
MNTPYPPQQPGNWDPQGAGQQYPTSGAPGQYGQQYPTSGAPGQYGQQYPTSGAPGQYGQQGQYAQPGQPGQYAQQPGQYAQPGQQPGGGTGIALTTKFFPLSFLLLFFKPKVIINGMEIPGSWGRSMIPLPPGQHHLHIHVPYFLPSRIGPADVQVPVHPGQTVEVEYRAPVWAFSAGSMGAPPQKYNGMPILYALLAVSVVLILCSCLVPFISGSTS